MQNTQRPYLIAAAIASLIGLIMSFTVSFAEDRLEPAIQKTGKYETAIFAGGCFWCVEADFDKVKGVVSTTSGYTGGEVEKPTYKQVSYTDTGHYEAVLIKYNPEIVSYKELVEYYWRHVDPTDEGGQFCDRGDSYRTAIFVKNTDEQDIAQASKDTITTSGILDEAVVTPILKAKKFWPAEGYHQDYYKKNPLRYKFYRNSCGRDQRIKQVWKNAPSS